LPKRTPNAKRHTPHAKGGRRETLAATTAVAGWLERPVRTVWVKRVAAVFLLVPAWQLTKTFFAVFSHATTQRGVWLTEEFWFLGLGAALWMCWFFASIWTLGKPQPLRAYVFAHELTHAIWVWLMGGRVSAFEHSSRGGYIVTNKSNFWIALAPYFYPFYTMAAVAFFAIVGLFYDVTHPDVRVLWVPVSQWMFLTIGVTWGFHFSFTCWMIPKGQSDLSSHGTFFSLVLIYFVNLVLITLFVIVADRGTSFRGFAHALSVNFEEFSAWVVAGVQQVFAR
jgi:hypothetical protein